MFNRNSGLVKTWLRLIKSGSKTREQVPNLSNLREIVFAILDEQN